MLRKAELCREPGVVPGPVSPRDEQWPSSAISLHYAENFPTPRLEGDFGAMATTKGADFGMPDGALGSHSGGRSAAANPAPFPTGPAAGGLQRMRCSGFDGLQVCPRHQRRHQTTHELDEDLDTSLRGDGFIRYFGEAFEQLRGDVYRLTCLELGPGAVVPVHCLQARAEFANNLIRNIYDRMCEVDPAGNVPRPADRRLGFGGKRTFDEQIPREQR